MTIYKRLLSTAYFILILFALQAQPPDFVWHEQSLNNVQSCVEYQGDACDIKPGNLPFMSTINPEHMEDVGIGLRTEYKNQANSWRVFYTIDGTTPQVDNLDFTSARAGTTTLVSTPTNLRCCEFDPEIPLPQPSYSVNVGNVALCIIPGQPSGTTVKYIVQSALNNPAYVNDAGARRGEVGYCSSISDCAKVFQYDVLAAAPVELSSFDATPKGDEVLLEWSTSSEENNSHFEVERSFNSKDWELVDIVDGEGNSQQEINYELTDQKPFPGVNYYRLIQVDFDGENSASKVVSVKLLDKKPITLFPNPIQSNTLSINASDHRLRLANLSIFSSTGQQVFASEVNFENKITQINLDELNRGIYIIRITDSNGLPLAQERLVRM